MNQEIASTSGVTLLRLSAVETRTGLKKSAIYAGMKAGTFPGCVKLGPRASAWSSTSVDAWIAERIRAGCVGTSSGFAQRRDAIGQVREEGRCCASGQAAMKSPRAAKSTAVDNQSDNNPITGDSE